MPILGELIFQDHKIHGYEKVVEIKEEASGLHAIIAIHNTTLGPALGGIRAFPYETFEQAMTDVLRLAKGMTYKSAVARTGTGGAKSVILTKGIKKSKELLHAFGEAINVFKGQYIGAEDVGMSVEDLAVISERTHYTVGLPHPQSSGDPSYFTAWGGYRGIQAVCQALWGSQSVKGKTIAIQGLGSVGMKLAATLFWEGAQLIVADVDAARTLHARRQYGAQIVTAEEILSIPCDILAPCALGGCLNLNTIPRLRCKAVAGLANNQLLTDVDGQALAARGILYAPDYVINSGGLINVCTELEKAGYDPKKARDRIEHIYQALLEIFSTAAKTGKPTAQVADETAMNNLKNGIGKRTEAVVFHHASVS